MAGFIERGTFALNTATGNQTVSLVDTNFGQVMFIRLWGTSRTAAGSLGAHHKTAIGMASYRGSVVQQGYACNYGEDGAASSTSASGKNTTALLKYLVGVAPVTVEAEIDLVSLGTAQFVINVVDGPPSGYLIHYEAWGQGALSDAYVDTIGITTSAGTQDETVVAGFGTPDLIFTIDGGGNNLADGNDDAATMLGWGRSDTEQVCSVMKDDNGSATMQIQQWQKTGDLFLTTLSDAANDPGTYCQAGLTARANWPADGFQITKTDPPGATRTFIYAALKFASGVAVTMGESSTPTVASTVTLAGPGAGYNAKYLLNAHANVPAQSTPEGNHASLGYWGTGSYDGTRQGHSGWGQDDGNAASVIWLTASTTQAIDMYTPSADGTKTAGATGGFSGDDATLDFNADPDSLARSFIWLVVALQTGQNVAVSGLASASAFGSPTAVPGAVNVALSGLASASAFGSVTPVPGNVNVGISGLASASAFGSVTATLGGPQTVQASGLASASAFGAVTPVPGGVAVGVSGLASASQFGAVATAPGNVNVGVSGLASVSAFGTVTTTTSTDVPVSGLGSASAFGAVTILTGPVSVSVPGLASASAFGAPTIGEDGAPTFAPHIHGGKHRR